MANITNNFIRVELDILDDMESYFKLRDLYEEDSRTLIDSKIEWEEMPGRKQSRISITKTANIKNKDDWSSQALWFIDYLEKFDKYFRPKIKAL